MITLIILQKKIKRNINEIGHKFLIIREEYKLLEALDLVKQMHYLI